MGLFKKPSWSSYEQPGITLPGQPDPNNWHIVRSKQDHEFLIVEIKYPNCTTFEGRKILVYRNCTIAKLVAQTQIDPHFSQSSDYHSPIARFIPTASGWAMAELFVSAALLR